MDRWLLTYEGYDPKTEGLREALCTLGNGYVATRGAVAEATADSVHYPGTYLAGCYDRLISEVSGHSLENEDLVNAPNWLPLTFRIDGGPWFTLDDASAFQLVSYRQELDLRRGVLTRAVAVSDQAGRRTKLTQRRVVSMDDPHVAALETTVVPENWQGRLEIRSALDGRVTNSGVARYRDLAEAHLRPDGEGEAGEQIWLRVHTASSGISIAIAARTRLSCDAVSETTLQEPGWIARELAVDACEGVPVTVEKVVAIFTSRDRAIAECALAARSRAARADDFDVLLEQHSLAWQRLWSRTQMSVRHPAAQQVLNLHMFHLLQTVSEHSVDLDVGVPARGLHGEAYRGHVFWDEIFVLPFLSLRFPEIARALLLYRWRRLPEARWAARQAGLPGAMYPWQSGSDGREETPSMHLNPLSGRWLPDRSRLQRHVGLAIACNVWRFYEATGDLEFLAEYGAEMLLEVARFFAGLATYDRTDDRYDIRDVMGPDEYHDGYPWRAEAGLDNNAYTNVMAVWTLRKTFALLKLLPEDRSAELRERLRVTPAELARFEHVARRMRIVFHDGVISQFEGYERLEELDWEAYRAKYGDVRRLDRILEAEGDTVNRYRASKQADVLMLFFLLSEEELADILTGLGYPPPPDLAARTIRYYLPRTCHGSTLSELVNAWLLAGTDTDRAWALLLDTLRADVDDTQHGTTPEGIHLGAMAGTVDLVQRRLAGLEPRGDTLALDPRLPADLPELRFGLRYRGHWGVEVTCHQDFLRVTLRRAAASPITVSVAGRTVSIEPGGSWETPLTAGRTIDPEPRRA